MKIALPLLILAAFILVVISFSFSHSQPLYARIVIGGADIRAEIADTHEKQIRGLSGRGRLTPEEGMLFVFNQPSRQNMWMKDMYFPLDIFWIRGGKIMHIEKNVPIPPSQERSAPARIYESDTDANFVLETNAGFAAEHNVKVGDTVSILLPSQKTIRGDK